MNGMACEACSLPHQGAGLRQQAGDLAANELVAGGLLAIRMQPVRVADVPRANGGPVVVGHGFPGRGELGASGVEGVAVLVLCAPDGLVRSHRIDREHGVLGAVDIRVDPEAE